MGDSTLATSTLQQTHPSHLLIGFLKGIVPHSVQAKGNKIKQNV